MDISKDNNPSLNALKCIDIDLNVTGRKRCSVGASVDDDRTQPPTPPICCRPLRLSIFDVRRFAMATLTSSSERWCASSLLRNNASPRAINVTVSPSPRTSELAALVRTMAAPGRVRVLAHPSFRASDRTALATACGVSSRRREGV